MLADYIDIIKMVMLGLDIIVALILLRFVLSGLKRGFARNLFRLILLLVLILFFSIGCKGIIRNLIEIELPINYDVYADTVSLKSIVETMVADNLFDGDIVALQQSGLTDFITDVTVSAVSIVLFTVMSILIYILLGPIITLIFKIFMPCIRKKRDGVKVRYSRTSKLLGLGCSLARFVILMMLFFVPLYGALEIGCVVVENAALVDEDMKELNAELDEAVGNSLMLKVTSNFGKKKNGTFGIGAKTLGTRFLITTDYGNINIVKEMDVIGGYLPRAIELAFEFEETEGINEVVQLIEDEDINTITNYLADSKIIKIAYPVTIKYLSTQDDLFGDDVNIDFNDLENININNDLKKLQPFFVSLLHCAKQIDLENFDALALLENKLIIEEVLDAINIILNLEITDKVVLKLGTSYLNDLLEENNLEHLVGLINNDYLKNKFITDVKSLYNAYLLLDESGIIDYFLNESEEEFVINEQVKENLKNFVDLVLNLELIKNQEKKIVQTIFVVTNTEPEFYEGMFNENIDWAKEVDSVGEIINTLIETVLSIDLEIFDTENVLDYLTLLETEALVDGVSDILEIAIKMQLAEKYVLPLVVEYVEDFLINSDLEEFKGIVDVDYIKDSLVKDINELVDTYKILNETKILDYFLEENSEITFNNEIKAKLTSAFNKIIELDLIEDNEKVLVAYVVSIFGSELNIDLEAMLEEDIDWSLEMHTLVEVVIDAFEFMIECEFDAENIQGLIENENFTTLFPNLVDKVFTLQIAEKYVSPIIINTLEDVLSGIGFEKFAEYIDASYLKNNLSKDLVSILDLYDIFVELGLEDMLGGSMQIELSEDEQEKFRLAMTKLLNLHIIDNHESELIILLCDTCGLGDFIAYDENSFKDIDWDVETDKFVDVLIALLNVSNLDGFDENYLESDNFEETSEQLGDLFDALVKCSITKNFAFELIDNLIGSIGYDISLSEQDKLAIEENTGKVEFSALTKVAKDAMNLFESDNTDYTSLKGEDVSKLMLDASEGIIASKVMGSLLNEVLGENGLNIMPKDQETGEKLYDFTKPKILKDQATNIGNCIDLVNNLQSFEPDNFDSISNIVSSLESLGNLEGEDNIVEDLLTEFLPVDELEIPEDIDWSEEAKLVEEVLNLYQESENKDDFEIDDSELLDKIEDSGFAEIILDYLGIFGSK